MTGPSDRLSDYRAKRDFTRTTEPEGADAHADGRSFVIQKHDATRLHYDLRLEWEGAMLSWAVTRGPSADPAQKRLAVRTEDHPLDYRTFEGTIPKTDYGGGTVMIWDRGFWAPDEDFAAGLAAGKLKFTLLGQRMTGKWALVRMARAERRENWLLIKERDGAVGDDPDGLTRTHDRSVATGRTMAEIASGAKATATARRSARPAFRAVQLATLRAAAPEGGDWIHETKFDGYRCLAAVGAGGARLYTRAGNDWTARFTGLAYAFDTLPCRNALIDGEVMAATVTGSAFSSLRWALERGDPLVFYAFDLLTLDGTSLVDLPLLDRRARLATLLSTRPALGVLRMSEHIVGGGPEIFRHACEAGGEGIVSKRADSPYRPGRSGDWLKIKCVRREGFVIGGLSSSTRRGRPFASLLVGAWEDGRLVYRGRVGTGFDEAAYEALGRGVEPVPDCPFDAVPAPIAKGARWVRPDLVAEVAFAELTADGHIRHGSFRGLRAAPPPAPSPDAPRIAGIAITHGSRIVFPDAGVTKRDVAAHYARVAERMLAIGGHRPLSLLRCPDGIGGERFFQKHAGHGFEAFGRVSITDSSGQPADCLTASTPAALIQGAQMGMVEMHIWGARTDRIERPDRIVFDLDPDEGLGWPHVRDAAEEIRARLNRIGLASVPVLSGGKGVHVCVILRRDHGWETVRGFAKTFAHLLAAERPETFTAALSKARRKGRIFIDWMRNERGATAIAPYSLRARPNASVAMPVTWEALVEAEGPDIVRIADVGDLLARPCPYLGAMQHPQRLTADTVRRMEAPC